MTDAQPPLTWESSESQTSPRVASTLPPEVVTCLENARFLHLATCDDHMPHVSLMNYTYLPSYASPLLPTSAASILHCHPTRVASMSSTPFPSTPGPTIIMTTNPSSRKTTNLLANPRVSLLVHDWVSHRPPTRRLSGQNSTSPSDPAHRPSLASLLVSMNTDALSSISATMNGSATILPAGSAEEAWCKTQHLENNSGDAMGDGEGDGGRGCFIEGERVRVVVVRIEEGRIADWKGGVRDWVIRQEGEERGVRQEGRLVNGV
ncbi:hypothetical protein B0A49_02926 [Cryomyces minteri]|uniref:Pyridoxamine 5'-phosphate oxidase N-terminal domain-containing protein n=1 Tax=Cryomyces minteri TaxID=331657 RepID=A0A4U0XIN7_9PEZI|nr:hypothetical protein B0A49_02926 [Cryomyces minteri]